jgi:hypothetical protein
MHHLRTLVAPILAPLPAEQARPLVEPLYDLCLELSGSDLFRRSPAVVEVWTRLLPQAGAELAQEPRLLPAALSNAAYNMEREESAQVEAWLLRMELCRPVCRSARQWLQAGQVASWLHGMAHYRDSAIAVGNSLPVALRAELCPHWEQVVADPWFGMRDAAAPRVIGKVGSFLGFGGRFRQPPWVAYAGDDRFLVEDGGESWILCADAFGATLKAGSAEIRDSARPDVQLLGSGSLKWAGQSVNMGEIAPVRSSATSPHIMAATSDLSHHVFLILGPEP